MSAGRYRFNDFCLDPVDRRLTQAGRPVEVNARYLDALILLVGQHGQLISKDRFLDEVWRGVPVTDEALTQCIRSLRRLLDDDAARPRFIETVPKHGYRFIAAVTWKDGVSTLPAQTAPKPSDTPWRPDLRLGLAGMMGGGVAGLLGGLAYGSIGAAGASGQGMGGASVLLVLACLTTLLALLGGAGVGFGIAATTRLGDRPGPWSIAGGALGGLVVGAVVKLLGLDAFDLLFGQSPGNFTGAVEGAILGAGVGLGAWLAGRWGDLKALRRGTILAALTTATSGLLITSLGGRLLGGSLDLLTRQFPASRLRLDTVGHLFGEPGFGPISNAVTGTTEGLLFGACVVGAMILARRRWPS